MTTQNSYWTYKGNIVNTLMDLPAQTIGFIYLISNIETGQYYLGKKSLYSHRTLPPLKGTKRKRKVTKESKWQEYMSSNPEVQEWTSYTKEILECCNTPKELTFRETEALFCLKTMEDERSLNSNILGKFYPKDVLREII
tara:strand:+ start:2224 stop:2643 length:420 start_codon:yes stop_codon:yes gene_type:complete